MDASTSESSQDTPKTTQIWTLNQLCLIPKMKHCSKALALQVLTFLSAVAFVDVGPKAASSKLPEIKLLAPGKTELAQSVQDIAAARAFVLATDALPRMAANDTPATDAQNQTQHKSNPQAQHKHSGPLLLPQVSSPFCNVWRFVCSVCHTAVSRC